MYTYVHKQRFSIYVTRGRFEIPLLYDIGCCQGGQVFQDFLFFFLYKKRDEYRRKVSNPILEKNHGILLKDLCTGPKIFPTQTSPVVVL